MKNFLPLNFFIKIKSMNNLKNKKYHIRNKHGYKNSNKNNYQICS